MGTNTTIDGFTGEHEFLSNFHTGHPVSVNGASYPTAEHAFQALKFEDEATRADIRAAKTPGKAKQLGRRTRMSPKRKMDWDHGIAEVAMRTVLRAKFRHPDLARKLIATGTAELVEANRHHDNRWGDCTCGRPSCKPRGHNQLGKHLMAVRAELIADRAEEPRERITPRDIVTTPRDAHRIGAAEDAREWGNPDDDDRAEDMNDAAILGRGL